MWCDAAAGDRGYSSTDVRTWLTEREIEAVIPKHQEELGPDDYDAARYDKVVANYLATVTTACICEWF